MISFNNVSKFILSGLTCHVPKGLSVGIIGASGAGKTTLKGNGKGSVGWNTVV